MLRRFQDAGHRPVALAGGATGMVGDPSGRSEERNLLDDETLDANVAAIKAQMARILDFDDGRALLVDNRDWTAGVTLLDFLRDVGKHVTVNQMLARESVKARLASEQGISYTEFSYMLLQAHDYLRLHRHLGVELQIGGSDQWGNILSGIDLIRRVRAAVHGLSWPLLTAPDGTKLGKTTGRPRLAGPAARARTASSSTGCRPTTGRWGSSWPSSRSWRWPRSTVAADHGRARASASAAWRRRSRPLVHGAEAAATAAEQAAERCCSADRRWRPGRGAGRWWPRRCRPPRCPDERPGRRASTWPLLVECRLASSKGDARRSLEQGAVSVNGERVAPGPVDPAPGRAHGRYVLRKGKRSYALLVRARQ